MFPCHKPNIENKAQGSLDATLDSPGQLLTHDGSDLAVLPPGADGQVLTADSSAPLGLAWRGCSVPGFPGSSTDNAVVRFDGTSGNVVKNSSVLVDDDGNVYQPGSKAIQWGSDVKLYHSGSGLVLGSAFNGDPSLTEFTAGKVWTNEVYTPSIESNVALRVRAGGIGMWLSSGDLILDHNLSVGQNAVVSGELSANTIKPTSDSKVTVSSDADVIGDLGVAGDLGVTGELSANTIKPTSDSKVTISSGADVIGSLVVTGDHGVTGELWTAGNITVAGKATLGSTLDVNDNAQFTRDVAVSGILTAADATFTNPISAPNFPSAATDNAVVRFDGTGGNVVQDSVVTIADDGTITTPAGISARNLNLVQVNTAQIAFSVGVNGDPNPRARFAVTAGGTVQWGNGGIMDVRLQHIATQTLLLSGVSGPSATLALDYGSSITWIGSPSTSNTLNLNGGQVYAGTLNIAPNGSLAWKDTGSGNGGTLVNTADGQWELRDSSGETSTTSLKVGQVDGLPVTNWIIDADFVDQDGIMGISCRIRVAKLTNKIWYFEVGDASFIAAKDGYVMFYLGVRADFIRNIPLTPMYIGSEWGTVLYNQITRYLTIRPGLSYPLGSFVQGNEYSWSGVSFTLSEV